MKKNKLEQKFEELNQYEEYFYAQGKYNIVGIDEVGRGPLAGPVVVAGVVLDSENPIYGLDDSKKLSPRKREKLALEIKQNAVACAVSSVQPVTIDKYGIAEAINMAIQRVIVKLESKIKIDVILIDYVKYRTEYDIVPLVKGDQKSNSIAAASILAKVHRDSYMYKLDKKYPGYGFATNVGYGTKEHRSALESLGYIEKIHRTSFEPIKSMEEK